MESLNFSILSHFLSFRLGGGAAGQIYICTSTYIYNNMMREGGGLGFVKYFFLTRYVSKKRLDQPKKKEKLDWRKESSLSPLIDR